MMRLVLFTIFLLVVGCTYNTEQISPDRKESDMWNQSQLGVGVRDNKEANTKDGWQQSGTLVTGNETKNVSLQANFPESGAYTIQFSVKKPAAPINGIEILADISWQVEGGSIDRRVSVCDGMSLTGVAQGVKVIARDNSGLLGAPEEYVVSIAVAKGTRGSANQPPMLADAEGDPINGSGSGPETITIDIPKNVGITSVEVTAVNVDAAGLLVATELIVQQRNPLFVGSLKSTNPDVTPGFVALHPLATRIDLVFADANVAHTHTWAIVFGVDG